VRHRVPALAFLLLLLGGSALGFIERIYSLQEVLNESSHVCIGRIEKIDRDRRLVVCAAERAFKGKLEFQRIKMNISLGPGDQVRYLLGRLQEGAPFIIYYKRNGDGLVSCVHAGDTWYQLFATDEPDRDKVWWRFTHLEVYMGRTYNGSTTDLIELTRDITAGRARPPKADPSVPKLDYSRVAVAPPPRVAEPPRPEPTGDGLEAIPGWTVEDSWARPAKIEIEATEDRGKVMTLRCDGAGDKKVAVTLLYRVDLSSHTRFAACVDNPGDTPLSVAVAFGSAPDWVMFEAPPVVVPPRAKAAPVSFALTTPHFKCEASQWKHTQPVPNNGRVDKIMLLAEGVPTKGQIRFDRILGAKGGFSRRLEFPHPGGEVRGISWADVNGDERLDALLCCDQGNVLLVNEGDAFTDQTKPFRLQGGSRSASWADYNGDDHPDLLTSSFQLFTNEGAGFRDDSRLIQIPGGRNPEGAGWIDYNGDGRPDVLITNGEHGICLLENTGKAPQWFRDVSDKAGLGPKGLGVGNGDFVAFADYDGDGYTDFLYNLGPGVLARNQGDGTFKRDTASGIDVKASNDLKRGLCFADFDNDGDLDLFVPDSAKPRLYRNNNDGTFTDVLEASGDLANSPRDSVAAAWGDVDCDGSLDLFVCHRTGASRLYLGDGKGKFTDATESVGLGGLVPASAASFADVDDDGDLDLMVNLERKAVLAFNDVDRAAGHAPVTVRLATRKGVVGAVVRALDENGRPLGLRELNGAESCGGQATPVAHFGLALRKCRISVCLSDGRVAQTLLTVEPTGQQLIFHDEDFK